jgi:hypothetical protein
MHKEDLIDLLVLIGFGICWVLMGVLVLASVWTLFR